MVNTGYYKIVKLDYHEGLRFPHFDRIESTPDRLDQILKPMMQGVTPPPPKGRA